MPTSPFPWRTTAVASIALLLALATPAAAQYPRGLKTHLRLVNSMSDQTSPGEWRGGDGWLTARPLVTHGVNNVSNPRGASSNSDFTSVADYGYLHFYGFGSAQSAPGEGLFLWADDWIGGEPRAQYRDRLYVTSATLPVGTSVAVQFQLTLSGWTNIVDTNPSAPYSAVFTAARAGNSPTFTISLANATGTTSGLFNTKVGDSIDVHCRFHVSLHAYGMQQAGPRTGSIAADLAVNVGAAPTTAGVTLTSNSNTLDVPPAAAAGFALEGARPNPARGERLAIRFTLPSGDRALLSLYDLGGRRLAEREVGVLGAGAHVVDLANGRRLDPGVYFVRLDRGLEHRTARVLVLD